MAPLGCAIQVHQTSNQRQTWAEHSLDGWYLRTSDKHYHCHAVFIKKMQSEQLSDTVAFQHKYLTQPSLTPEERIVQALSDVKHTLSKMKSVYGSS